MLTKALETKIGFLLPDLFALIFDGWSSTDNTHYVSPYAVCPSKNGGGILSDYYLLSFSPLFNETDQCAKNYVNFLELILPLFGKELLNVMFIIGDNCSVNVKIARLLSLPLLAIKLFYLEHETLLEKIHLLMKKLKSSKMRGNLRHHTEYAPKSRQETRWSSTFNMLNRYKQIEQSIDQIPKKLKSWFLPKRSILL